MAKMDEDDFFGENRYTREYQGKVAIALGEYVDQENLMERDSLSDLRNVICRQFTTAMKNVVGGERVEKVQATLNGKVHRCTVLPANAYGEWCEEHDTDDVLDRLDEISGDYRPGGWTTGQLSDEGVHKIRATLDELAEEFDCSYSTLAQVGYRNTYENIEERDSSVKIEVRYADR